MREQKALHSTSSIQGRQPFSSFDSTANATLNRPATYPCRSRPVGTPYWRLRLKLWFSSMDAPSTPRYGPCLHLHKGSCSPSALLPPHSLDRPTPTIYHPRCIRSSRRRQQSTNRTLTLASMTGFPSFGLWRSLLSMAMRTRLTIGSHHRKAIPPRGMSQKYPTLCRVARFQKANGRGKFQAWDPSPRILNKEQGPFCLPGTSSSGRRKGGQSARPGTLLAAICTGATGRAGWAICVIH